MKITKKQLTKIIKEELEMFEQNSGEPDVAAALEELAELEEVLLSMGAGTDLKEPYARRGRSNEEVRQMELSNEMMQYLRAARVALGADSHRE